MLINKTLNDLKSKNKKAFIPYITAGDPNLDATELFIDKLVKSGADIIELGVPFSDPVADGIVNQLSSQRALKNNISLNKILDFVKILREKNYTIPIVLFTYFNPIFRLGLENFALKSKESGVNGVLIVDLPPESAREYKTIMDKNNLETIFLASPTTSIERMKLIDEMSSGFIYYVARNGITGTQSKISETLEEEVNKLKSNVTNNICIGFGISNGEQAKEVSKLADGVIVGSAIVKLINEEDNINTISDKIYDFSSIITKSINE
ncbi:MAG: tryptophan synthase subunit alpha [Candidatus Sericytochromatia bacterium]